MEGWDWVSASVIYGTAIGGFMFGFVQLVARAFMRSGEARPPNIAGTPSSLIAIRGGIAGRQGVTSQNVARGCGRSRLSTTCEIIVNHLLDVRPRHRCHLDV